MDLFLQPGKKKVWFFFKFFICTYVRVNKVMP